MKKEKDSAIFADKATEIVGSGKFIVIFAISLFVYIIYQIIVPEQFRFDPYPFILLNLMLSFLAGFQAPIIMMSQNRAAERDRQTAKNTEHMVGQVKEMMEQNSLMMEQQTVMMAQLKQMIEKVEEISEEILEDEEEILANERKIMEK